MGEIIEGWGKGERDGRDKRRSGEGREMGEITEDQRKRVSWER